MTQGEILLEQRHGFTEVSPGSVSDAVDARSTVDAAKTGLAPPREAQDLEPLAEHAIRMTIEGGLQQDIAALEPQPTSIRELLVSTAKDERCVGFSMLMARHVMGSREALRNAETYVPPRGR